MRESPPEVRFDPLTSTQVLGAMLEPSPSAFATLEITGAGIAVIVNARDVKTRDPVSQPFWKKIIPESVVCPEGDPGDIDDGYQPSKLCPLPSELQGLVIGNCEP